MDSFKHEVLQAFRQKVYTTFGLRADALFEIIDAVMTAPVIESLAHLSLASSFQRKWGSVYDALNAGTIDLTKLEQLVADYPLENETDWYAIDASVWPRCDAETSPGGATTTTIPGIPMANPLLRDGTIPGSYRFPIAVPVGLPLSGFAE